MPSLGCAGMPEKRRGGTRPYGIASTHGRTIRWTCMFDPNLVTCDTMALGIHLRGSDPPASGALAGRSGQRAVRRALGPTRRVYTAGDLVAVFRNAPASHDLRRLALASRRQGAAAWYESGVLYLTMHDNGRKRAICGTTALGLHLPGALGRPRAEPSQESRSSEGVHNGVRVTRKGAPRRSVEPGLCARPRLDSWSPATRWT